MILRNVFLVVMFLILSFSEAWAVEVTLGGGDGSVILKGAGVEVVYKNIVGSEYNVSRSLIDINGAPGLLVLSKDAFYFTLAVRERQVLLDCAYSDKRNKYNGARMTVGMCGLNVQLSESYVEIAEDNSNYLSNTIFSFDTRPLLEQGGARKFLLGEIGDFKVYDRYVSAEALLNSRPNKYIESSHGCFDYGDAVVFLMFFDKVGATLSYLDVLQPESPVTFRRVDEGDLKKLAFKACS